MNETTQMIMKQLNSKIIQGPTGPTGPQGPKGDKGADGTSGSGGGGSGILVYPTLTALQTALPNGSTTPVWVTADNSWYYWTGAVTVTIPATPATPTATAGNAQVALTWGAVSGATGYKVYRGGTLVSSPTTNSYTDTSLTNGVVYSYTVSATNTAGESAQSAAANATPTATVTIPATPSTPTATAGSNKVDLAWTAVSGATSYKVYRGGTLLASPTTNSHSDTTAVNGTAYSYTISAVNSAGESGQSPSASATPVAPVAVGTTLFDSDTFDRADADVPGSTVGARAWVESAASSSANVWGIRGNKLQFVTMSVEGILATDFGTSDCAVEVVMTTKSSLTSNRIIGRYVANNNFILVQGNSVFHYNAGWNALTPTSGANADYVAGDKVKVIFSGSTITLLVNDVQKATYTTTSLTGTKFGVGSGVAGSQFDALKIFT